MYQRINAGTGGQEGVHGQGGFRIDQGYIRHHCLADNGELNPFALVGNDHELRHIGRGAGGGRDQHQRRAGDVDGIHPFEFENAAAVRGHDADGLGAIHRAAAANRDNRGAAVLVVFLGTEHDLLDARVGRDSGKQVVGNILLLQAVLHIPYPAGGQHAGVGYDQHLFGTETTDEAANPVAAAGTEDNFG